MWYLHPSPVQISCSMDTNLEKFIEICINSFQLKHEASDLKFYKHQYRRSVLVDNIEHGKLEKHPLILIPSKHNLCYYM